MKLKELHFFLLLFLNVLNDPFKLGAFLTKIRRHTMIVVAIL